jgi:polyprenyl-phospho-N-acetylgalactosaminyl synthase
MNRSSVYIIVPVFQEQEEVSKTIKTLLTLGCSIVIVDDGSPTNQAVFIEDYPVHFLRHTINLGQGAALQTGVEYALEHGAEWIVHFDADGQHLASDIPRLLQPLFSDECDIVFGSRLLEKGNSAIPLSKRFLLHTARYLHYFLTGLLLSDAHNGLRAMNKKAALLLTITENRMGHASELLFLIKKNKLRLKEIAVTVLYSTYSMAKGQSSWNSVRIGFDLLLHKLFK